MISQEIAVHITGSAPIKLHQGAYEGALVRAGVGDRGRILGGDGYGVGGTGGAAVVDDELHRIVARFIDDEDRHHRSGVTQYGGAAQWAGDKAPLVGEQVPIDITGGTTIQLDRRPHRGALVRTSVGHGRAVLGGNRQGVWGAAELPVVDTELDGILAGFVDHEGGGHCCGIGQRSSAA